MKFLTKSENSKRTLSFFSGMSSSSLNIGPFNCLITRNLVGRPFKINNGQTVFQTDETWLTILLVILTANLHNHDRTNIWDPGYPSVLFCPRFLEIFDFHGNNLLICTNVPFQGYRWDQNFGPVRSPMILLCNLNRFAHQLFDFDLETFLLSVRLCPKTQTTCSFSVLEYLIS